MISTNMSDTSLDVWSKIKPDYPKRQNKVLDAIKKYPDHTTAEIAKILHVSINNISGSPARLAKRGLTKRMEKRNCAVTGNEAYTWRAI